MLNWANRFNIFCLLDNNYYSFESPAFECLLGIDVKESITLNHPALFSELKKFSAQHKDWLFGHINYPSIKKNQIDFPDGFFFIPKIVVKLTHDKVIIESDEILPAAIFEEIDSMPDIISKNISSEISIQQRISEAEYISKIETFQKHILRGDCYEINFCQEFYSTKATINPLFTYQQLTKISPNPFAAFYKLEDKYCLCASPERFIKKTGNQIISQPIKGTSKRNLVDVEKDEAAKQHLINSGKEKSENVMIVDLVRNDLSKIGEEGTVVVKELFGIYSFPQVHQMISTIQCIVNESTHWTDLVEACYPMGSMTGAPKKRVMELIETHEATARGLFSGSIGYVTPDGDFDFNVIIRSLFYNETLHYLSFQAGGGITCKSNAVEEYQESLLKAAAIKKILES